MEKHTLALSVAILFGLPWWFVLAGCLCAVLSGRPRASRIVGYGAGLLGGFAAILCATDVLRNDLSGTVTLFYTTPILPFGLRVDVVAASFALTFGIATTIVCLAALGFARAFDANAGSRLASLFSFFLGAMLLVILAEGVFSFLISWELMSLLGYFLIVHHHERSEVRQAGFLYLMMAHSATALIVAGMFTISAHAGGALSFASLAEVAPAMPELLRGLLFVAFAIGFATKAGLAPFHIWMPRAESLAPAHVGAIMSGATINVALYGLVRMGFDVLGPGPQWWGWTLIALGALSAVTGVVYAVLERDLLRLLAFSSVENMGIIVIGLGAALVLRSNGMAVAAGLALIAALVHMTNHAIFKSALFLGAGAVDQTTGTRDIEQLGGLARRMPVTSACVLIASLAAAALPPLNGFVGEWFLFQSLLSVGRVGGVGLSAVGASAVAALMALAGGLAVLAFVKAYGLSYLGRPRTVAAGEAVEASRWVRLSLVLAAVACLILGILPGTLVNVLRTTARIVGTDSGTTFAMTGGVIALGAPMQTGRLTTYVPILSIAVALILGGSVWLIFRALGSVPRRIGPIWVCGFDFEMPMQYSSAGFAEPVRLFFRSILRPSRSATSSGGMLPYFPARLRPRGHVLALAEHHIYIPLLHALRHGARRFSIVQNGDLRAYLAYLFVTLIVLLWALR